MLDVNKLRNNINNLIKTDGPIWHAAKESIISLYRPVKSDEFNIDKTITDAAEKFADTFTNSLQADKVDLKLAEYIDQYIKSQSFIIQLPIPSEGTTLSSPTGPVSGVINITPKTNIKII